MKERERKINEKLQAMKTCSECSEMDFSCVGSFPAPFPPSLTPPEEMHCQCGIIKLVDWLYANVLNMVRLKQHRIELNQLWKHDFVFFSSALALLSSVISSLFVAIRELGYKFATKPSFQRKVYQIRKYSNQKQHILAIQAQSVAGCEWDIRPKTVAAFWSNSNSKFWI